MTENFLSPTTRTYRRRLFQKPTYGAKKSTAETFPAENFGRQCVPNFNL